MKVLVVGANGQIGRQIVQLLGSSQEYHVKAMVRNPDQAEELQKLGAETIIADLEKDVTGTAEDCEAIIFAAGSGGHTGADKTILVDLDGAFKMIEEGERANVKRFLMISAFNADYPERGSDKILHYNVAKKRADERLLNSKLNYTIIRPGRLTNEAGTGKILVGENLQYGEIPREDVAKTVVAALGLPHTSKKTFKLLTGTTPIHEALNSV